MEANEGSEGENLASFQWQYIIGDVVGGLTNAVRNNDEDLIIFWGKFMPQTCSLHYHSLA